MAVNPTISQLDAPQIFKRVYDTTNDSIRCNLGDVNGLSFNLSASGGAGDSIATQGISSSTKVSLTSASTGTVLGPVSCVGMKSVNLYTNTTTTVGSGQLLTVQVSPSDTDNVWYSTGLTVTESATAGVVVMGTSTTIVGRRVQVIIASAIASGTFDTYLVMQGV